MIKICFVCHGNICRSPMAEFIMKDLIKKKNLEDKFYIESKATNTEEIGNCRGDKNKQCCQHISAAVGCSCQ